MNERELQLRAAAEAINVLSRELVERIDRISGLESEVKALRALDVLRHLVPGNGGVMEVSCADYEQYVDDQMRQLSDHIKSLEQLIEGYCETCSAFHNNDHKPVEP